MWNALNCSALTCPAILYQSYKLLSTTIGCSQMPLRCLKLPCFKILCFKLNLNLGIGMCLSGSPHQAVTSYCLSSILFCACFCFTVEHFVRSRCNLQHFSLSCLQECVGQCAAHFAVHFAACRTALGAMCYVLHICAICHVPCATYWNFDPAACCRLALPLCADYNMLCKEVDVCWTLLRGEDLYSVLCAEVQHWCWTLLPGVEVCWTLMCGEDWEKIWIGHLSLSLRLPHVANVAQN